MIFRRRSRPALLARVREGFSPRKGWRRGFEYIGRRVQRLPDTPHRIALGVACGVVASFTPLFTLHIFVAMGLALAVRANPIAAALGTLFGNPITFPIIATLALGIGGWMLGSDLNDAGARFDLGMVFGDIGGFMERLFWPYLAGGVIPGLAASALTYALVRPAVALYQQRRRTKLGSAARDRVATRLKRRAVKVNPVPEGLE